MPDTDPQPKNWAEMSFDMRLFISFHVCMMVLMLMHFIFSLGIRVEMGVVFCIAALLVALSVRNRIRSGWHWQRIGGRNVFGALCVAALILFFLGATLPGTTILNPNLFPFLAGGGNFLVFGVLGALKITCQSNTEFLRQCGERQSEKPSASISAPQLPKSKRIMMAAFRNYFFLVWIGAVTFFWKFNAAIASGSTQPTTTQTEKLTSHGHTVYITPERKRTVNWFEHCLTIGIPSIFVIGAFFHFVLDVKVFSKSSSSDSKQQA
jgi:hypothetical protein